MYVVKISIRIGINAKTALIDQQTCGDVNLKFFPLLSYIRKTSKVNETNCSCPCIISFQLFTNIS